jgi:hypothetical protein
MSKESMLNEKKVPAEYEKSARPIEKKCRANMKNVHAQ